MLAADAPPPPPPVVKDALRDRLLQLKARTTLLEILEEFRDASKKDQSLLGVNLEVRVVDGVATLTGVVPSAALIPDVAKRLSKVQGLAKVRSEGIRVEAPTFEPAPLRFESPAIAPTVTESASPNPATGSLNVKPTRDLPPIPTAAAPAPTTVALELPPIHVVGPTAPEPRVPTTVTGRETPPRPEADPVAVAVDRFVSADRRFRGLRAELQKGGVVVVRAPAERREDAMTCARGLSRLVGVQRVVLEDAALPR